MGSRRKNLLENVFMTEEQKLKVDYATKVHKNKKVYSRKNYQIQFD
jgi:hypothetical protein